MNLIKEIKSYTLYTVLAVVLLLFSCDKTKLKHKVIRSKSHFSFTNNELPENVCRYFYRTNKYGDIIEFSDKCDKYNVGDTIVGVARNYR